MCDKSLAVVLLSGGLDSATSAAIAAAQGYKLVALSLRYGQLHDKELESAKTIAKELDINSHYIIDVDIAQWGGSSLTDESLSIPLDGVSPHNIPSTYVPGRNTVFIALALSLAEAKGAKAIFLGINMIDYSVYPDWRSEYLKAYQDLANISSKAGIEGNTIELIAPLIKKTKVDIVQEAIKLGVPIEKTWSCYKGDQDPCGLCDSCSIRDQALIEAGYPSLATTNGQKIYYLNK